MARKALPEVQKLKDRIMELTDAETSELYEWLELLVDVREAEAKRRTALDLI